MTELKQQIEALSLSYFDEVVAIRRHFHQNPELSCEEINTAEYICRKLDEYGIPYKSGVAETGVVGFIRGRNPDSCCVALRADMDALPVIEENDVEYKSATPGKMHACGHDVHMACLLGASKILNQLHDQFDGTVKLIFQPSEETYPGGAIRMINEGVLENPAPAFVIAQHVINTLGAGDIGLRPGAYMASTDEIFITVRGKGGHAATPSQVVDPVLIASHIVVALQQIVSRNADPVMPTVLSFGKMIANGRTNIIPDEVRLEGTVRTYSESWRQEVHRRIDQIASGMAQGMGATAEVKVSHGYPFLYNDPSLTGRLSDLASEYLGNEHVKVLEQRMTAEDFAYFALKVPSCMFRLGIANETKGIRSNLHSSTFDVDEKSMETGMGLLAWLAMRLTTGLVFCMLFAMMTFLPFTSYSQDIKPAPAPLLPFQQDAPKPGNEEQVALQFYQNQEFAQAAELFEQLYEKKPSLYYYQYLVFSLIETKEYDKAEKLIKKCQRAEPEMLRYMVDMGYVSFRSGNQEKAKKLYEEALKKLGPSQQQIFELANAFVIRQENEYAIRTYVKGRQLMNNTYPFGFELAGVYERMGDYRNAIEEYLNMLDINKSYLTTVQDRIQMTLSYDVNNEKNDMLRKILLTRAQKNPDNTNYAELLWWYSIQQKDFDLALLQAKALDRRFRENGEKVVSLANLAMSNEKYEVAIDCYQYLISKGTECPYYDLARRELANTRYLKTISEPSPARKELELLEKEFSDELSYSGEKPENIQSIKNLAHIRAFYLGKSEEATDLLNRAIEMVGVAAAEKAKCKIELADILLFNDDVWEATLLYQQAYQDFKYDVLGQEAKFKNAKLSFYIGEFNWAKAQADVLKAATSKFISNDAIALSLLISENYDPDSNTIALGIYARADLLDYRNEDDLALRALDSIPRLFSDHPILQQVMYKKAEILRKQGHYERSDSLFQQLVREYPDGILADESLMQAGLLNEKQLNNREKAMALFQELLDKYPGSIFVPDARKKFRILRGDSSH